MDHIHHKAVAIPEQVVAASSWSPLPLSAQYFVMSKLRRRCSSWCGDCGLVDVPGGMGESVVVGDGGGNRGGMSQNCHWRGCIMPKSAGQSGGRLADGLSGRFVYTASSVTIQWHPLEQCSLAFPSPSTGSILLPPPTTDKLSAPRRESDNELPSGIESDLNNIQYTSPLNPFMTPLTGFLCNDPKLSPIHGSIIICSSNINGRLSTPEQSSFTCFFDMDSKPTFQQSTCNFEPKFQQT